MASTARPLPRAISGISGNFLRPSIVAAGRDPDDLTVGPSSGLHLEGEAKAWRDYWSAGQGCGAIRDIPSTGELCDRLVAGYRESLIAAATEVAQHG